jgi:hypothetical protein
MWDNVKPCWAGQDVDVDEAAYAPGSCDSCPPAAVTVRAKRRLVEKMYDERCSPAAESLLLDDVRQLQPAGLLLGDLVFECS